MLSAKDVVKAHKVLSGVVVNTPLEYDHYLSEKYGAKIYRAYCLSYTNHR